MANINEIKDRRDVVKSIGDFTKSLQLIASGRMVKLRGLVESSRRFVEEATVILRELELERSKKLESELGISKTDIHKMMEETKGKKTEASRATAIIVVTSDQGLCGSYNTDITKRMEQIVNDYPKADYFVIGRKGQDYFNRVAGKLSLKYYPYSIPEEVGIEDLRPIIGMFYHYEQIFLVYSKYINTATRDVVMIELAIPNIETRELAIEETEGKFTFEPGIEQIIDSLSAKLRYSLFRQQVLDSKLSLYSAQMIAMQIAGDNADDRLKELKLEYNKARRSNIDRKIQELLAGRVLWA